MNPTQQVLLAWLLMTWIALAVPDHHVYVDAKKHASHPIPPAVMLADEMP